MEAASTESIPVVDLADLRSEGGPERAAAALRRAFGEFGLVYVQNHGVDTEVLERFYDDWVELTQRSEEEKRKKTKPEPRRLISERCGPEKRNCHILAQFHLPKQRRLRKCMQY